MTGRVCPTTKRTSPTASIATTANKPMIVSTKGRYALRVMLAMAQRGGEEYIPIKEIAEQEGISQKYLESIMTILSKGVLHHPRAYGLFPQQLLRDKAHVGQAGCHDQCLL